MNSGRFFILTVAAIATLPLGPVASPADPNGLSMLLRLEVTPAADQTASQLRSDELSCYEQTEQDMGKDPFAFKPADESEQQATGKAIDTFIENFATCMKTKKYRVK